MSGMFDFDIVDVRRVFYHVRPGNLVNAKGGYGNVIGVATISLDPLFFACHIAQYAFGKGYGRSAWSILLFRVVNFVQTYIVFREAIHDPGEIFVDLEEDINPQAKV